MQVGLLTTLGTNIGDDFIRVGICALLREALGGEEEFAPQNKHAPEAMAARNWATWVDRALSHMPGGTGRGVFQRLARRHGWAGKSRWEKARLLVQCGTPVYWRNCGSCEWAGPIWRDTMIRLREERGAAILNIGAGSCWPWEERNDARLSAASEKFVREITHAARLTVVRDALAERIVSAAGGKAVRLPCPAFLAGRVLNAQRAKPGGRPRVAVNYMRAGGHYDFGQGVDAAAWEAAVRGLIGAHRREADFFFICHDEKEAQLAGTVDSSLPVVFPKTVEEYAAAAAGATAGVFNRLHASVFFAGLGIPSIAIGTDTRMLMVEELGLPVRYVKEASLSALDGDFRKMISTVEEESARLDELRGNTWKAYLELLNMVLSEMEF